ncbi:type VI secretion system Vgr family protein [Burkholderia multivorans]|uniref:type VI secretion system Vgr family protein n=1 Tax=Burkholderia multivorans TaxID=87883 RepID=UPI001C228B23|nr:type VI secretion system tip protein TssI/VgrG [Burkholderia multivorans]MBU9309051.1 type VI secretion system tip protein VgrG [Burkholderia multivorans]MBU9573536.1 type VI secretion system tip protein VgrG [Burkholderia multivorans]MDN7948986.1 type VI secretion system tip protein TssI/VgrG [Burkholderia multivorans]MDN7965458.1 type VI secretion system tip protein TssI/VgrG [Burkholderia multivorans]
MALRPPALGELKYRDLYNAIHRGLLQNNRLLRLDTPLGQNALIPLRARGSARIGRDYHWTLDVASLRDDTALLSLMHQPITLWLQQPSGPYSDPVYRPIHGFVHRVGYLGGDGGLSTYQLEFSSALVFLGGTHNDEGWLEQTAQEIVSDLLNRYPQLQGRFRFDLSREPAVRSWCRQSETDLHFFHRLLEDEGWYCYWVHEPVRDGETPKTTLVIVDQVAALPDAKPADFARDAGVDEAVSGVVQWAAMQTMQSLRYESSAFDYKRPASRFEATATLASTHYGADEGRHETQQQAIPHAPMTVYEPTAYGYPDSDVGAARARRRVQGWDARARRYFGVGGLRWIDAGSRFVLNGHPRHLERDDADRTFLVVEARWFIENNVPIGRPTNEFPLSLRASLAEQREIHGARFATPPHAEDGTAGFFVLEVEAQDARVEFRSPFEHPKPAMSIEHALVVTQQGSEAWSNERNQVRVHFAWDRKNPDGTFNASPLLSSMQADTGDGYGAVHVPRAGEWVLVGYWGNDCDKPFILGRVNGGTTPAPWHTNVLLSGFRSRGFGNTGAYNAFIHDDATHQGGTRLISYTGKSYAALTQGYLIQQDGNTRGRYLGEGFMLHADEYGAVRASKGLSISSHPKAYDDEQLSVDEARTQLQKAGMLVESLSSASTTAQAESLQAGQDALKDLTAAAQQAVSGQTSGGVTAGGGTGNANGFAKPVIVISTPADFAAVADRSAHVIAEAEANVISGANTHLATGKSLIAAAAEKISLFVQKAGMKLFAAKGPIEVSAHTDEIKLNSAKDMSLFSKKRIVLEATDELILKCGGSYLRLTKEGIEDGTRGARTIKSASFSRQGPSSVAEYMNSLPSAKFNDPYVLRDRITGEVLKNHPYELIRGDGTRLTGVTNELGHVAEQKSEDIEKLAVRALRPSPNGSAA